MTSLPSGRRYVRFRDPHGVTGEGFIGDGSPVLRGIEGGAAPVPAGRVLGLDDVELLSPVEPRTVVCVGLNHASTLGYAKPPEGAEPLLFLKAAGAVVGPGAAISCPEGVDAVDVAGELAVVISRAAYKVSEREAYDHIWGYTCANDVAVRDWMGSQPQWFDAKSSEGFCPLGPWIVPATEVSQPRISVRVNGVVAQSGSTADMVWSIPQLLARVTRNLTLHRGDVILTGSPVGLVKARPGDTVDVVIDGIGTLTNQVVPSPASGRAEDPYEPALEGRQAC